MIIVQPGWQGWLPQNLAIEEVRAIKQLLIAAVVTSSGDLPKIDIEVGTDSLFQNFRNLY